VIAKRKKENRVWTWFKSHFLVIFLSFAFLLIALFLVAYNQTSISVQNSYTSSKASVFKYTNGSEVGRVYREDRGVTILNRN
jgi:hypothetical protein